MNVIKKVIKLLIPRYVRFKTKEFILNFSEQRLFDYLRETRGQKKFLIVGVPEHPNIGDHAIAVAERKFLMDHFPQIDIVEITLDSYCYNCRKLEQFKSDFFVLSNGGGNLGTLYWWAEHAVHAVLKCFYNQKVVIFPQTVHWEADDFHTKQIDKYINIYEQHPDLTIFIRDKSIDFMENVINRNKKFLVVNTPDIVLYLNKSEKKQKRDKILFCLRSDKEKYIEQDDVLKLTSYAKTKYGDIYFTDMMHKAVIPLQCRDFVLERKFDEFRSAKLVITDRLHGMIFAAITGTPCIALNNSSKKVEGVYSLWLKKLPYIYWANTINEAIEKIDNIDLNTTYDYDPLIFAEHWNNIAQIVETGTKK